MSTNNNSTMQSNLPVLKTLKMLLNGGYARSESGATFMVSGFELPNASRKDARDAIRAGATAAAAWSARDPYNRGQILYRVAEMLESRRTEFEETLRILGVEENAAAEDLTAAIEAWVHFAGWADKTGQVLATVNDVPSGMVSFTSAEHLGLVGIVCGTRPSFATISVAAAASLAAGNSVVLVGDAAWCVPALLFGEVLGVSDVPSGVVQILSSAREETPRTLAAASQVQGLDLTAAGDQATDLAVLAAETFTRVLRTTPEDSLGRLRWQMERKTFWHPTAR